MLYYSISTMLKGVDVILMKTNSLQATATYKYILFLNLVNSVFVTSGEWVNGLICPIFAI